MYKEIIDRITKTIEVEPFNKTVTNGDIFAVDLNKQTLFPLAHIIVNSVTDYSVTLQFNITILFMDIEDGNANDILDTQLTLATRVIEILNRNTDLFELSNNPSYEPFNERFENSLSGWACTFDCIVKNPMVIC